MMSGSESRFIAFIAVLVLVVLVVVLVLLLVILDVEDVFSGLTVFSGVVEFSAGMTILVFIVGGRGRRGLIDTPVLLLLVLLVLLYLLIIYNIVVSMASQFMSGSSWLGVRSKALMSTPV